MVRRWQFRALWCSGIIFAVALVISSGGWGNGFLENWDDPQYITANPDILAITWENVRTIFTHYYLQTYAPLQIFSYMLDHALWDFNPLPYLLVNTALHALSGILFYRLLCRLHFDWEWALCAALLFIVHPVQVESVAWLSQRKTVLAMVFFLAAFWQYLSYAESVEHRWRRYVLALGCFALAILSKSVAVVLPAILVSYDVLLRKRRGRFAALALEKVPFALLALGGALIPTFVQRASDILGGSAPAAAMTMVTVYKRYLGLLFWPLSLSAEYHIEIKRALDADVLAAVSLLVLTPVVIALAGRERRKEAWFWLSVFFIGFIPVSQIVPFDHPMNDRYLYFPMLGFAALMVLVLQHGAERLHFSGKAMVVAFGTLLLLLAGLSWQRTGVWADARTLWQDAVVKQPGAAGAWESLGHAYEKSGDYRQALAHYRRAEALDATSYEIHYKLGTASLGLGDVAAAERHFSRALELNPVYDRALYNLGYTQLLAGQYQASVRTFERALQLEPGAVDLLVFLGASYYCSGDLRAAGRAYGEVRRSDDRGEFPMLATGMLSLVALRQGDLATSRRFWQEAVAGGLSEAEIYLNWARLEAIAHHREDALQFVAAALARGVGNPTLLEDDLSFRNLYDDAEFIRMVKP